MQTSNEVELAALSEKLSTDELPVAAARLFKRWHQETDGSPETVLAFFSAMSDQSGLLRVHMGDFLEH